MFIISFILTFFQSLAHELQEPHVKQYEIIVTENGHAYTHVIPACNAAKAQKAACKYHAGFDKVSIKEIV